MVKDLCVSRSTYSTKYPLFFKCLWPGAGAGLAFYMFLFFCNNITQIFVPRIDGGWIAELFAQGRIARVGFKFLAVGAPITCDPICPVPYALCLVPCGGCGCGGGGGNAGCRIPVVCIYWESYNLPMGDFAL